MADENKNPDEYEYPSEEYHRGGEYIPPADESLEPGPSRASFLSRRLLLAGGLLIAVIIVYLILSFMHTRRTAELAQPTPAVSAVPPAAPVAQAQPPAQITEVAPTVPTQTPDALQSLAQQNQINQQTMADLQNQIQQLRNQLNQVNNSISTLTNQMQVIVNEIRAIGISRSLSGRALPAVGTGTLYHLKALVPGRAWLQSKEGHTTTVSIGDRLPGYGIIQMINTQQGIVTTSSGALIQYGPRDS